MSTFGVEDKKDVPNREQLLQLAIQAAKAGNREGASVMLRRVLNEDPRNERAMMWLAKVAATKAERRQWLERVLMVNPSNQSAKDTLRRMTYAANARDNSVLVIFGIVAVVLIVIAVIVLIAAQTL